MVVLGWLLRGWLLAAAVGWKIGSETGLTTRVGAAEIVEGRTLVLRDVRLFHPDRGGDFVSVREIELPFASRVLSFDPGALGDVAVSGLLLELRPTDLEGLPAPRSDPEGSEDTDGSSDEAPPAGPALIEVRDSEIRFLLPVGSERHLTLPMTDVAFRIRRTDGGGWTLEDARGDLLGGRTRVHAAAAPDGTWRAQGSVAGADLSGVAGVGGWPDAFGGELDAFLDLSGDGEGAAAGSHPLTGAGWLRIRRGALWELPVFSDLLGLLGLVAGHGDRVDALAADLRIDDHRVHLLEVEARGAPLGLWGRGSIGLDGRDADVSFVPRIAEGVTRSLPLIGEPAQALLDLVNGSAVEVRVRGDLDALVVETVAVPMLSDPVRSLIGLFEGR